MWVLLGLAALSACGGSSTPTTPTSTTSTTAPVPEALKSGPRTPLPGTPGPATLSGTWTGTVGSTPVIEFGGPPYCYYTVQFTNFTSTVQATAGQVISARVTALHTEQAIRNCPYTVGAPGTHTYVFNSSSLTDRHILIRYDTLDGNYPWATLDFEGDISADGRTMTGTYTLQRVDQPTAPNLQWRLTIPITMLN
jgi:hypothetical protein